VYPIRFISRAQRSDWQERAPASPLVSVRIPELESQPILLCDASARPHRKERRDVTALKRPVLTDFQQLCLIPRYLRVADNSTCLYCLLTPVESSSPPLLFSSKSIIALYRGGVKQTQNKRLNKPSICCSTVLPHPLAIFFEAMEGMLWLAAVRK
jgi:hypothetical protein